MNQASSAYQAIAVPLGHDSSITVSVSLASGSCAQRLLEIEHGHMNGMTGLLGQFTPTCDDDGSYSAVQCQGSV